jgi:flavin reductase (DIM6/NTAB) family NADH-FMN oxidoreductase RutF
MQHFNSTTINQWDKFYRTNFINTLSGFKSATLIGTVKPNGQPNLGLFSNVVHVGANPAIIGFINRPTAAAPHTIQNIQTNSVYTMNLMSQQYTQHTHAASAKIDDATDEFAYCNLTLEWQPNITAPFVQQAVVKYALSLLEIIPIKHNNTFLVLGTLTNAFVPQHLIEPDGFISLEKANIITTLGIDGYYTTTKNTRYQYAKFNQPTQEL